MPRRNRNAADRPSLRGMSAARFRQADAASLIASVAVRLEAGALAEAGGVLVDVQVGPGVVFHDADQLAGELVATLGTNVGHVADSLRRLSA